jgi:hypothetical protein
VRAEEPFLLSDLDELCKLLGNADEVIPMLEVASGNHDQQTIGMRHDVDHFLEPALEMARWEAGRGFHSTFFFLHTASYWKQRTEMAEALDEISGLGHEIGFHLNSISAAIEHGGDPVEIATEALAELRSYGHPVVGVVAHGDPLCHRHGYVNDEIFRESQRRSYGLPGREIAGVRLRPISRLDLGLVYDPNWLPRGNYLSDSGGRWSQPFEEIASTYPPPFGQLHMLVHPIWWRKALKGIGVAA